MSHSACLELQYHDDLPDVVCMETQHLTQCGNSVITGYLCPFQCAWNNMTLLCPATGTGNNL